LLKASTSPKILCFSVLLREREIDRYREREHAKLQQLVRDRAQMQRRNQTPELDDDQLSVWDSTETDDDAVVRVRTAYSILRSCTNFHGNVGVLRAENGLPRIHVTSFHETVQFLMQFPLIHFSYLVSFFRTKYMCVCV